MISNTDMTTTDPSSIDNFVYCPRAYQGRIMLGRKKYHINTFICMNNQIYWNKNFWYRVWFMVFNATFNNFLAISWRSVLLVEVSGVPGEKYQPVASHWQIVSDNVASSTPCNNKTKPWINRIPVFTEFK